MLALLSRVVNRFVTSAPAPTAAVVVSPSASPTRSDSSMITTTHDAAHVTPIPIQLRISCCRLGLVRVIGQGT